MENQTRIDLPPGVSRPYDVFVNGVVQTEGADFEVFGSTLVFPRLFTQERRLGFWRWTFLFLGVWSSYRHYDSIDVVFTRDGRRAVESLKPAAWARAS